MDHNKICMGCMEEKGELKTCPKCGWIEGTQADSPLHLNPGTVLKGQYLIGRVLGHGGFGITYLASDLNLGTKLAIKEYFPQGMATRNTDAATISVYSGNTKQQFEYGLDKFIEEARTLSKFDEIPEIVTAKDFFKENGTAYLVMSYIEGITLKQYTEQNGGKLPLDSLLNIMFPIMKALEHVHKTGILHRDISPDNIYITKNFNAKLLDFGAARFAIGEQSKSMSVILKPGFAPEEQYRSKGKQGPWTDVYAVGATIYKALTGQTPPEALDRLEEESIKRPSELGIDLNGNFEEALMKAMAVRSADRFQSIEEFEAELFREISKESMDNHTYMAPGTNANKKYKGITIMGAAIVAVLLLCLFTPRIRSTLTFHKQDTDIKSSDTAKAQKEERTTASTASNSTPVQTETASNTSSATQVINDDPKPIPTFDISQINEVINRYTDSNNISVSIIDLKNKQQYSTSNASQKFVAAGFYLPIYLEINNMVSQGTVNLDMGIRPSSNVYFGGTGTLKKDNAINGNYTLRDYINAMMDSMDNGATNTLIEQLGGLDAINRAMQSEGYFDTVFARQFGDAAAATQGKNNYTSSMDACDMIEKLFNDGKYNTLKSSANLYNITMPEGRTYNAQFGTIASSLNEFAIISSGDTVYGIVVLTNNVGKSATQAISDINNAVDKQFR